MNKKLLVSLLMTGPMALPALADINFEGNSEFTDPNTWTKPTVGTMEINGDNVTCAIGTGEMSRTLNLPQGTYSIKFSSSSNLKLTVNGEELTAADGAYEFEVSATGETTIAIAASDASKAYSFSNFELSLVFNADAIGGFMAEQMLRLPEITQLKEGEQSSLYEEYGQLDARLNALKTNVEAVAQIGAEGSDPEKDLAFYSENELWASPNKIETEISDLSTAITAWNTKAAQENQAYDNRVANDSKKVELLGQLESLQTQLDEFALRSDKASEYVRNAIDAPYDAMEEAVQAYEAKINAAFPTPTPSIPVTFDDNYTALTQQMEALNAAYTTADNDFTVYNKVVKRYKKLGDALLVAQNQISALKGENIEGYTDFSDLFNADKVKWLNEMTAAYEGLTNNDEIIKAVENPTPEDIKGSSTDEVRLKATMQAYNNAKNVIEEGSQKHVEFVKRQNAEYANGINQVNTFKSGLADATKDFVPASTQIAEDLAAAVKETNDANQALLDYIYKLYHEKNLFTGAPWGDDSHGDETDFDYEELVDAVSTALAKVRKITGEQGSAANEAIANLKSALDKAYEALTTPEDLKDIVDIPAVFAPNKAELENAINDLTASSTAGDIKKVGQAIKDMTAFAESLIKTFQAVNGDLTALNTALEAAKTYINGLYLTNEENRPELTSNVTVNAGDKAYSLNGEENGAEAQYATWKQQLANIGQMSGGACEDAINNMKADSEAAIKALTAALPELQKACGFKSVSLNLTDVNAAFAQAQTLLHAQLQNTDNGYEYCHKPLENIWKDLNDYTTGINKTNVAGLDAAKYTAFNTTLKADYEALPGIEANINKVKASNDAYAALSEGVGVARDAIKDLQKYIGDNCRTDEAKATYNAQADALTKTADEIETALTDAWSDKVENPTFSCAEKREEFVKQINDLVNSVTTTRQAVDNNNLRNSNQLTELNKVLSDINNAIENLKKTSETGSGDWIEQLEALKSGDYLNISKTIADAYNAGESVAQDEAILASIKALADKVANIEDEFTNGIAKEVKDANEATVEASTWESIQTDMANEYQTAIAEYNKLRYGLTNADYKAVVIPVVEKYADLYDYNNDINDLKLAVNDWINKQNTDLVIFTADAFNAESVAKAQALIDAMKAHVKAMYDDVNKVAETYYQTYSNEIYSTVQADKAKMQDAGFTAEEVTGYFKDADAKYNEAVHEYAVAQLNQNVKLAVSMDNVANLLDEVLPLIDIQKWCVEGWGNQWNDALGKFTEWEAAIAGATDASADVVEAQQAIYDENKEKAEAENTAVSEISENLVDSYKEHSDALKAALDAMEAAVKAITDSDEYNKANNEEYNDLTTTVIPGLDNDFHALTAYLGKYVAPNVDTTAIATAISNLKTLVENNKTALLDADKELKDNIESAIEAINTSITKAYKNGSDNEKSYVVSTLIPQVKTAYNDAVQYGEVGDYNEQINEIVTAINNLVYSAETKDAYQTSLLEYESKLCDIMSALQKSCSDKNPEIVDGAAAALADLNALYDQTNGAITTGKTALEALETLKTELPDEYNALLDKYGDLATELSDIKTAYEAEGNRVALTKQEYENKINNIADEVKALADEVTAASTKAEAQKAQREANQTAYDRLSAELAGYQTALDAAKAQIEEWGVADTMMPHVNVIQGQVDESKEALETAYDEGNGSLNEESTLTNPGIGGSINWLNKEAAKTYASAKLDDAKAALDAVTLDGNYVNKDELLQKKADLSNQYAELLDQQATADYAGFVEIAAKAQAIADEAAALVETAEANSYVPGDVNLNPDGEVNILDIQLLANWIGEGMTYDELYEENPRQAMAADLNGDKQINVVDYTLEIKLALGEEINTVRYRKAPAAVSEDSSLSMISMESEDGMKTYAIQVNNATAFIGGQLDLKTTGNARIESVEGAERLTDHEVMPYEWADGTVRTLIASMTNDAMLDNSGSIILVKVSGDGELQVENATFVDVNFNAHNLRSTGSTFIDQIVDGAKDMGRRIYNAAGVQFNKLQKGLNIIRGKDGKTVKRMNNK